MLNELLKRLIELDPELCQLSGFEIFTIAGRGICADFTYSHVGTYIYERELVLAWVQYAVQEAVKARGWSLELKRIYWRVNPIYEASVFTPKTDGWHESENITEALLSAYIKALEGVKDGIKC